MATKEEMIKAIKNISEEDKRKLKKLPKWEVFDVDMKKKRRIKSCLGLQLKQKK